MEYLPLSKETTQAAQHVVDLAISILRRRWRISATDVLDLKQEGFLAAWSAHTSYEEKRGSWSRWVFRHVYGRIRKCAKYWARRGIVGAPRKWEPHIVSLTADVIEEIQHGTPLQPEERAENVSEKLTECLSCKARELLYSRYGIASDSDAPKSVAELATERGVTRRQISRLLRNAQKTAKECLKKSA